MAYLVKLASELASTYGRDIAVYGGSQAAGGLIGSALARQLGEDEEDLRNSKMRALGYGLAGSAAGGVLGGLATGGNLGGIVLGSAAGGGIANAHLNAKIRRERAAYLDEVKRHRKGKK
jgi:hypothetical protein